MVALVPARREAVRVRQGVTMTAAVIALSVALLAAIGGLVLVAKWGRDSQQRADNAHDLYRAQQDLTDSIRIERDELVGKLAATDTQLREAKDRLRLVEQQRDKALEEAREHIRKEIRSAPDAIAALNAVLAAAPGVRKRAEETKADAEADPLGGGTAGLLITDLR